MKNKHKPKLGPLGIILAVLLLAIVAIYYANKTDPSYIPLSNTQNSDLQTYTSQALKISFSYPKDWIVNEKDYSILISSYKTRIGENVSPNKEQIKMFIDKFSGCHMTIEENLKDPACGEGGKLVKNNQIV